MLSVLELFFSGEHFTARAREVKVLKSLNKMSYTPEDQFKGNCVRRRLDNSMNERERRSTEWIELDIVVGWIVEHRAR